MDSIRDIYRIGYGPSSSHTMAPRKAAERFYQRYPDAAHYEVTLYGSLAATGKGHMTDVAIMQSIPGIQIFWEPHVFKPFHPNGMEFRAYDEAGNETTRWLVYSIGGGALAEEKGQTPSKTPSKTPSGSPLKGEYSSLPLREGQGGSIPALLPLLHHNTCHTCNNCHISI